MEFQSTKAGLIILGCNEGNHSILTESTNNRTLKRSYEDFRNYFLNDLEVPVNNIFDLYNSKKNVISLLIAIEEFLSNNDFNDIFIYYVGHGFVKTRNYSFGFLISDTTNELEFRTVLEFKKLNSSISRYSKGMRVFYIIDCCFAGKVLQSLLSAGISNIANSIKRKAKGIVTYLAVDSNEGSYAFENSNHSVFTGNFLRTLKSGIPNKKHKLSFRDIDDTIQVLPIYDDERLSRPMLQDLNYFQKNSNDYLIFPNNSSIIEDQQGIISETIFLKLQDQALYLFSTPAPIVPNPFEFDFLDPLNNGQKYSILKYIIVEYLKQAGINNDGHINYILGEAITLFKLPKIYQKYLVSFCFEKIPPQAFIGMELKGIVDIKKTVNYIDKNQLMDRKQIFLRLREFDDIFRFNKTHNKKDQYRYDLMKSKWEVLMKTYLSKSFNSFQIINIKDFDLIPVSRSDFEFAYESHLKDLDSTEYFLYEYYFERFESLPKKDFGRTVFALFTYCKKLIRHQYLESSRLLFKHILDFDFWRNSMKNRFERLPIEFHLNKCNELLKLIDNPFYELMFLFHIYQCLIREFADEKYIKKYGNRIQKLSNEINSNQIEEFNSSVLKHIQKTMKFYSKLY